MTDVPLWAKYTLTVEEAAVYFRIGENKLRKLNYLELVHFCLQYQEWKAQLKYLDGYSCGKNTDDVRLSKIGYLESPVESVVERRIELEERTTMIEAAAKAAAKDVYYRIYRKFFWLLDKARK